MIGPYFDELAREFAGMATFLKVDVDAVEQVAGDAGVTAMPTFQVWQVGVKVAGEEVVGAAKEALRALVQKYAVVGVPA
jgi:thioredoxin 1